MFRQKQKPVTCQKNEKKNGFSIHHLEHAFTLTGIVPYDVSICYSFFLQKYSIDFKIIPNCKCERL